MRKDRGFGRTGWLVLALAALVLAGCSSGWLFGPYEPRAKWRDAAERQCLRAGAVQPSEFIRRMKKIREKGSCGMNAPFRVIAVHDGNTFFDSEETLACGMIAATDEWLRKSVQPTAFRMLGSVVTEIDTLGSYSCRTINHRRGAPLSEHAFGNAIDVAAFRFADGRVISVESGWHGTPEEQAFLRAVHRGACEDFTTVIGPDGDRLHANHFHVDLARHGRNGDTRYCE